MSKRAPDKRFKPRTTIRNETKDQNEFHKEENTSDSISLDTLLKDVSYDLSTKPVEQSGKSSHSLFKTDVPESTGAAVNERADVFVTNSSELDSNSRAHKTEVDNEYNSAGSFDLDTRLGVLSHVLPKDEKDPALDNIVLHSDEESLFGESTQREMGTKRTPVISGQSSDDERHEALKCFSDIFSKNEMIHENDQEEKKELSEKLETVFARMRILAILMQSRICLPLMYPFNHTAYANSIDVNPIASSRWEKGTIVNCVAHIMPNMMSTIYICGILKAINALRYSRGGSVAHTENTAQSLSSFLKQNSLLSTANPNVYSHHSQFNKLTGLDAQNFTNQNVAPFSFQLPSASPHYKVDSTNVHIDKTKLRKKTSLGARGGDRVRFLRPQLWRMLQPGNEFRSKHLKWR